LLKQGRFIFRIEKIILINRFRYRKINTNSDFRRELILKAIGEKAYSKAITLAEAGIVADQKDKPGLVDEWKWHLLNIYQQQGNKPKIIEYARYLFLNSGRFRPQEMLSLWNKPFLLLP
jgi:hypothetical protein